MSYAHTQVAQIVAISRNRCIGKGNDLPWHIPNDLKHFKAMTTAETDAYVDTGLKGIVIMGRKTFESMGSKPLPKRVNFIVTTQMDYAQQKGLEGLKDVHVVHNLDDALTHAANVAHGLKFETIWVIGGERVFKRAMMFTDRIELTVVDTDIEDGDAFYPEIPEDFELTQESESFTDEKSGLSYKFMTYMVKKG
ncbi:dihydrofolate reductase [Psychrobacter sp. YP14]|jgi:dihydrofolate reductase|uniref:Dihydrofolate reductase n=3 Tax=Psychrobacter TaxID=497 RepID=A0A844M0U6_9GAMM|nr:MULTISPECIES: dihydrofolate reductase [Psychrobacter]AWT50031.1 dihydrofolate reductase [Psychrobacter sp. YP14]MUG32566.1 dihydrofolate reductase [Psychrobacter sanguinis]UNK05342.1 dihydrofolate reductase [Psychrobacter sp. PraFG1]